MIRHSINLIKKFQNFKIWFWKVRESTWSRLKTNLNHIPPSKGEWQPSLGIDIRSSSLPEMTESFEVRSAMKDRPMMRGLTVNTYSCNTQRCCQLLWYWEVAVLTIPSSLIKHLASPVSHFTLLANIVDLVNWTMYLISLILLHLLYNSGARSTYTTPGIVSRNTCTLLSALLRPEPVLNQSMHTYKAVWESTISKDPNPNPN